RRGSRGIAKQRHLTEEVAFFQFGQYQTPLGFVVEENIHAARTDDVHAGAKFGFDENRLSRFIGSNVNHAFKDLQLFNGQLLKQWNVLQDFGQRVLACSEAEDVSPNAVG